MGRSASDSEPATPQEIGEKLIAQAVLQIDRRPEGCGSTASKLKLFYN